jgi:hypothetical protein
MPPRKLLHPRSQSSCVGTDLTDIPASMFHMQELPMFITSAKLQLSQVAKSLS